MRVLILAEDCNPEWPSLPAVAYKAIRAIAERVDVVVATSARNCENIEKVGFGRAIVKYIDNEYIDSPMNRVSTWLRGGTAVGWTTAAAFAYPSYLAFEWEVWKKLKGELRNGEYDLVHRLTPMTPTLSSPMATWSPVPFVLGPLNGGLRWPPAFRSEQRQEREWLSYVRNAYRGLPYARSTLRKSSAILAAFEHTVSDLPQQVRSKTINFPEVGVDPALFADSAVRPVRKEKIILFAGRFVPYKLPGAVVEAFVSRPALYENHRLQMVGDGPERPALERLVQERQLGGRIEFLGWKTQAQLGSLMREADVFAFPSIRELGAGVVVEAMACGLACVVIDYGGPSALIAPDRGVKVPLLSRDRLVAEFGAALENLVADEHTTRRLGAEARRHVMLHYTWQAKAEKMCHVYDWVLGRGERPDFWTGA